MPSKERRDHRYFLTLERLLLLHGEDLTKLTGAARSHVEDLVRKGQSAAWSTDLASARTLISCRLGIACCGQGFDNDAIGRLLCPIGSDWNSGEVKNALRSTPQSSGVGAWPAVFYQNLGFDPQKPWEGFLRNRLLVVVISALSGPNTYLCGRNRLPHKRLFDTLFNHVDEHRDAMEVKELILWWDRWKGIAQAYIYRSLFFVFVHVYITISQKYQALVFVLMNFLQRFDAPSRRSFRARQQAMTLLPACSSCSSAESACVGKPQPQKTKRKSSKIHVLKPADGQERGTDMSDFLPSTWLAGSVVLDRAGRDNNPSLLLTTCQCTLPLTRLLKSKPQDNDGCRKSLNGLGFLTRRRSRFP
ncbi:hypothetical protein BKA70DRAFT_1404350 [Coprinopsis sp. MPI-PUGE-AT-0042]|nr:hypothetical protein BKA70DRAFT_1404350 [Coprinopsis sp. MPI-PUGE-AT-0042]